VAIEKQFKMPLVNPATGHSSKIWTVAGKIDGIVSLHLNWILEHKFVSSSIDIRPGSNYWLKLQIDPQISTYINAAEKLGYDVVAGCIYDVIRKPRIKPYTATPIEDRKYKKDGSLYAKQHAEDESLEEYRQRLQEDIAANPDAYYQRGEVFRNRIEEREAAYDLWYGVRNIRQSEKDGIWPRNPNGCWQYQRACDYWSVCVGETSIDDNIRYRTAENPHEELIDRSNENEYSHETVPF
jgi:hypothetical protein